MNRKILEKQGLVIVAVLFTWLGMKIRDTQLKMAINKEIKAVQNGEYDDQLREILEK